MTYTNGTEKSSRSKADYFKVLVANALAQHYKVGKTFQREISELEEIILSLRDGKYRINEQRERAKNTSVMLISFLIKEGITRVKDVEWVGRYHTTAFTFYKGVKNWGEALAYFDKHKELPDCEMFAELSLGDFELADSLGGYIAEEDTDQEIIDEIPRTLKEALGIEGENDRG
ncbi:MAG: hypothetical protein HY663_06985 [Chloroflexi bacterium]|nr:hypothetical protein [Chloroflexota bacterium]